MCIIMKNFKLEIIINEECSVITTKAKDESQAIRNAWDIFGLNIIIKSIERVGNDNGNN